MTSVARLSIIRMATRPGSEENPYLDGSEEELLRLLSSPDPGEVGRAVGAILAGSPPWPQRVHLSPQRHHLLDWFPFRPGGSLLEVGAGCGALTGLFAERVARVDALEPSVLRAEIIGARHRGASNVQVLVGDLASIPDHERYDYVTLIGVLEYAGRDTRAGDDPGRDPYLRMLTQARSHLGPDGTVLLAIENQLGLRYLAGHPEDHRGAPLAGIEDYLEQPGARTFGKAELEALLQDAGLGVERWYYPFPDYKHPSAVYSDELPPGAVEHAALLYPTPRHGPDAPEYFAEGRFARILARNRLEGLFANSFLVVARPR